VPVANVPWNVFEAHPVRVRYRLTINTPAGLKLSQTMKLELNKLFNLKDRQHPTLEATDRITIRADLELSIDPQVTVLGEQVEVGFLQSLTSNISQADYGLKGKLPAKRFRCLHDKYPVKDGEGNPWYKNPVTAVLNSGPVPKQVSLEIYDAPKFTYPALVPEGPLTRVTCKRDFLTCLAVRHRGQLRGIHSIVWRFSATSDALGRPTGGLSLIREEGPLTQFQTDAGVPTDIRTTGQSANASEKMELVT
jgi:hypothetical protein